MSIVIERASKVYGDKAVVRDVSLSVNAGEFFVLLGASGSGKSTLLKMLAGLIPMDEGRVLLNNRDVTNLPPQARNVGFVFQNYALFRHMTVAQNIAFGLEVRKVARPKRDARVRELLTLVGLEGYDDRYPAQLSGGQQQRVAVARALAYEPEVLLLDEPFGALDVKIRAQLRGSLRDLQRQLGVTTILVTHDQEEAFELADRIGIIEDGALLEIGTPDQLYRRPQTHWTATFLGEANLLDGQRNGTHVHVGQANIPAPEGTAWLSGQEVAVLIRPEELELANTPQELRGRAIGKGCVVEMTFIGSHERVIVQTEEDGVLQVLLSPDDVRRLNLVVGGEVVVGVRDYHLLPKA
jgi:sulfate transport system ATP-binding protein